MMAQSALERPSSHASCSTRRPRSTYASEQHVYWQVELRCSSIVDLHVAAVTSTCCCSM